MRAVVNYHIISYPVIKSLLMRNYLNVGNNCKFYLLLLIYLCALFLSIIRILS